MGNGIWIIMIVMIVLMFWLSSRSNKKRQAEEQQMRDSLVVGDEVTTIGGIIGKVVSVKGETFVLETTRDCTRIRFLKGAIRSIDVKVDDIAATMAESETETVTEPAPAPQKKSGKSKSKAKKAQSEDIVEALAQVTEDIISEAEENK